MEVKKQKVPPRTTLNEGELVKDQYSRVAAPGVSQRLSNGVEHDLFGACFDQQRGRQSKVHSKEMKFDWGVGEIWRGSGISQQSVRFGAARLAPRCCFAVTAAAGD